MGPSRGVQDEASLHGIDRGRDAGRGEPRYVLLGQLARREPGSGRYARRHSVDPKGAPVVTIDVPGNEIPTTPGVDEPVRLGGTDARRPGLVPIVEAQPLMAPADRSDRTVFASRSASEAIRPVQLRREHHCGSETQTRQPHDDVQRRRISPPVNRAWVETRAVAGIVSLLVLMVGSFHGIEVVRHPCVDRAHQESTPREIQASSDLKPRRHDG
jgi:hypothetical protein